MKTSPQPLKLRLITWQCSVADYGDVDDGERSYRDELYRTLARIDKIEDDSQSDDGSSRSSELPSTPGGFIFLPIW